jgi:hypothetical protein
VLDHYDTPTKATQSCANNQTQTMHRSASTSHISALENTTNIAKNAWHTHYCYQTTTPTTILHDNKLLKTIETMKHPACQLQQQQLLHYAALGSGSCCASRLTSPSQQLQCHPRHLLGSPPALTRLQATCATMNKLCQ